MKKYYLEIICVCCVLFTAVLFRPNPPATQPAKLGSVVRLLNNGQTYCSGTVIRKDLILTAAHCVTVETEFGPVGVRSDIEIRSYDNEPLGVIAQVKSVRVQMDQAILRGDFSLFNTRHVITDPENLTILRTKPLTACGYPMGGKFYCSKLHFKEPDDFYWKVNGVLIPGMSGGGVFDENGNVVATNMAVAGAYSVVSPTYDLDLEIDRNFK